MVYLVYLVRSMVDASTADELVREGDVGLGAARSRVIEDHGHAVAWRLAEPNVARNDGAVDLITKELADVGAHLLAQVRAVVVHRQQHAFDGERGIERRAHAVDRREQLGDPFEREVLAVERDEDGVGGDERVQREQAQRRGCVDEDEIEARPEGIEQPTEPVFAFGHRDELDLGAGEVPVGGDNREMVDARREDGACRIGAGRGEHVVDGAVGRGPTFESQSTRQVRLRIHVDEENSLVGQGQRRGEVDGGCGFGDATLLIGDSHDARIFGHTANTIWGVDVVARLLWTSGADSIKSVPRGTLIRLIQSRTYSVSESEGPRYRPRQSSRCSLSHSWPHAGHRFIRIVRLVSIRTPNVCPAIEQSGQIGGLPAPGLEFTISSERKASSV
jgi:hypothetical protein